MADIFYALDDGTRRDLLSSLQRHGSEVSVSDLTAELGLTQPAVSKHLKVLREHGFVAVREQGKHRYYRLNPAPFAELDNWLAPYLGGAESRDPGASDRGVDADAGPTVFAAWAGSEVGDRVGRAAADTAHSARVALEAAQEKLQGAQKRVGERVADKLPKWGKGE